MGRHGLLWLAGMALVIVWGCAAGQTSSTYTSPVGTSEADLLAQKGQPQKTIARPEGGKILVYETQRMDQVAVMGGGAWGKTEQTYYWLNPQGKVEKVRFYPYGRKKFIFPSEEEREGTTSPSQRLAQAAPAQAVQAPAAAPAPSPVVAAPAPPKPAAAAAPAPAAVAPTAVAAPKGMREASRLELSMSKEDVTRLLGLPERTEGFWAEGKQVMVWTYRLANQSGRQVLTPLVFENGRLAGWGDAYYLTILRKARNQTH
jgi:hypothetical protein